MLKINFDWKWFLGTSVSFTGIIIAIIFYYNNNQYGTLGYQVISVINVGDIGNESFGNLKLKYNNFIIDSGSIVTIIIENKTKNPIKSDDIVSPIYITFDKIKILDFSLKKKDPPNMELKLSKYDNKIMIKPTLLNSGDNFTIDVLTSGNFSSLNVTGRIAGAKRIEEFKKDKKSLNIIVGFFSILFSIACMVLLETLNSSFKHKHHVAIHMLSYSFSSLKFSLLFVSSVSLVLGLAALGYNVILSNTVILSIILVIVSLFISKLLHYDVLIHFTERKDKTNGKHRFFQIALDDKITISNSKNDNVISSKDK